MVKRSCGYKLTGKATLGGLHPVQGSKTCEGYGATGQSLKVIFVAEEIFCYIYDFVAFFNQKSIMFHSED